MNNGKLALVGRNSNCFSSLCENITDEQIAYRNNQIHACMQTATNDFFRLKRTRQFRDIRNDNRREMSNTKINGARIVDAERNCYGVMVSDDRGDSEYEFQFGSQFETLLSTCECTCWQNNSIACVQGAEIC